MPKALSPGPSELPREWVPSCAGRAWDSTNEENKSPENFSLTRHSMGKNCAHSCREVPWEELPSARGPQRRRVPCTGPESPWRPSHSVVLPPSGTVPAQCGVSSYQGGGEEMCREKRRGDALCTFLPSFLRIELVTFSPWASPAAVPGPPPPPPLEHSRGQHLPPPARGHLGLVVQGRMGNGFSGQFSHPWRHSYSPCSLSHSPASSLKGGAVPQGEV